MWSRFLKNRMMSSGVVLLILGVFGAMMGYAALINYSETCYVVPGFNPPCASIYQVGLLAPLYPLSVGLIGIGVLLGIMGAVFTVVGYSNVTRTEPGISTSKPRD